MIYRFNLVCPIHTDKEEQWDEKIQRQLKASQRCTSSWSWRRTIFFIQRSPTYVRRKSDNCPSKSLLNGRLHLCYTCYADELQPFFAAGTKKAEKCHKVATDTGKAPCYNSIVEKCGQFTCQQATCR